jgi:hypothetical protein
MPTHSYVKPERSSLLADSMAIVPLEGMAKEGFVFRRHAEVSAHEASLVLRMVRRHYSRCFGTLKAGGSPAFGLVNGAKLGPYWDYMDAELMVA